MEGRACCHEYAWQWLKGGLFGAGCALEFERRAPRVAVGHGDDNTLVIELFPVDDSLVYILGVLELAFADSG